MYKSEKAFKKWWENDKMELHIHQGQLNDYQIGGISFAAGCHFIMDEIEKSRSTCPDDCTHRKGRFCLLGTNHCTRMAVDFYTPQEKQR